MVYKLCLGNGKRDNRMSIDMENEDELGERVRAQRFLIEWEKEILEYGADKETKWFLEYVWEKI